MRIVLAVILLSLLATGVVGDPAREDIFHLDLAPPAPPPEAAPGTSDSAPGFVVELVFRRDEKILSSPRLTLYEAQRGHVSLLNHLPYVAGYRRGSVAGGRVTDPVVKVLATGLTVELCARRGDLAGTIGLTWEVRRSGCEEPLREWAIALKSLAEPLTIQLPEVVKSRVAGRCLLAAGEEALLCRLPDSEGDLVVSVVAHSLDSLVPEAGAAQRDFALKGASSLFSLDDLPSRAEMLEMALLRLPPEAEVPSPHHGRASGDLALQRLRAEKLVRFSGSACVEPGVVFEHLLETFYVQDFNVGGSNELFSGPPIIATVTAGIRAEVREGPELAWSFGTFPDEFATFTTELANFGPITVELPEITMRRGLLPLSSPVNFAPVAELPTGEKLVLMVVRRER